MYNMDVLEQESVYVVTWNEAMKCESLEEVYGLASYILIRYFCQLTTICTAIPAPVNCGYGSQISYILQAEHAATGS